MEALHDREHRTWLTRLVCGEVDPRSSEGVERLAACPRCRREWEELRPLRRRLDLLARPEPDAPRGRE